MKIEKIHSNHLSHALHLQFAGEAKELIEKHDPNTLRVAPQFDVFRVAVEREDLCYKIIRKSELSAEKEECDHRRDAILVGINDALRAALRHFDGGVTAAAKRLKVLIAGYNQPKPIGDLPYDAETATIVNLLQELNGKYAADVQITGLTHWVAELESRNNEFERLAKAYNEQTAEKPPFKIKDVRKEVDAASNNILHVLNAWIITEGEAAYTAFATEINTLTKHYNDLLAQHIGRNKARENGKTSERENG
jgi:hypothetical protein